MATNTGPDDARPDQAEPREREQPAVEDSEVDWFEPRRKESFPGSFSRDDAKLLLITFAGTVAANVMTVIAVAAAIIVDRRPGNQGTSTDFWHRPGIPRP